MKTADPPNEHQDHPEAVARRALIAALPALIATVAADEAQAQSAATVQPQSYKVVLENEYVRVLEYNSRPGMGVCGDGRHSHPAHLTVPLSQGKAKVKVGGKEIIAPAEIGAAFWEPAVTHEVENISGRNMRALIVEVKAAQGAPAGPPKPGGPR
jgi:hypothetical protein